MSESRLRVVDEQPEPTPGQPNEAAHAMLMLAFKALSQRALIAASASFTLLMVASAFWLWMVTLPQPSVLQLVGLGGYALFVLAIEWVRRR